MSAGIGKLIGKYRSRGGKKIAERNSSCLPVIDR